MSMFWGRVPSNGYDGSSFVRPLRCKPMREARRSNTEELDHGGKLLLPPSALNQLAELNIMYPMLFRVTCNDKETYCGVLEFTAEEGRVYMPAWMIRQLDCEDKIVTVYSTEMPTGTFVKLQPQSTAFLDIQHPRIVLERELRSFSCLAEGDLISIRFSGKTYDFKVLETKPTKAICIVEADVEVDFEAPPGYVEPTRPSPAPPQPVETPPSAGVSASPQPAPEASPKPPVFTPFSGEGVSLRGRTGSAAASTSTPGASFGVSSGASSASAASASSAAVPISRGSAASAAPPNLPSASPRSFTIGTSFSPRDAAPLHLPPGKFVFGKPSSFLPPPAASTSAAGSSSSSSSTPAPTTAASDGASMQKTTGFMPFGGQGSSLR